MTPWKFLARTRQAMERIRYADKLERRCSELIAENGHLRFELSLHDDSQNSPPLADLATMATAMVKYEKLARTRVTNLKAAIGRLLGVMNSQWCGADEQAMLRTARAIVEDEVDGVG